MVPGWLSGNQAYEAVQMAERLVEVWRFYSLGPNALPRAPADRGMYGLKLV